uniref:C2H2-type domain-containing protein n=1 Tax=Panagrolaimus sp. JU765 TaxID=591449 RepID=A0AC34R3F0_9BILA
MAETPKIWNPAIEDDCCQLKQEQFVADKTFVKDFPKTLPLPFSPIFPFGSLMPRFPSMPFLPPNFNSTLLAFCARNLQQQDHHQQKSCAKKKQAVNHPHILKQQSVLPKKIVPNPIVNAVLNGAPEASDIRSINHNVCAVCGESFRLTGDLVHHMRRERCRSSGTAPYPLKREKH